MTAAGEDSSVSGPDGGGFFPASTAVRPEPAAGLPLVSLQAMADAVRTLGLPVHGAPATGLPLVSNGHLGADILHVPANGKFPVHCHPGDHLLLCLAGSGTISIGERTYQVSPGDLYLVPGEVPHAVGAGDQDHVLVAIGSPHKPVDSPERMWLTDWDGNRTGSPLFA